MRGSSHLLILDDNDQLGYSSEGTPSTLIKDVTKVGKSVNLEKRTVIKSSSFSDVEYQFIPFKPWGIQIVTTTNLGEDNNLAIRMSVGIFAIQFLVAIAVILLTWVFSQRLAKALAEGNKARLQSEEANKA